MRLIAAIAVVAVAASADARPDPTPLEWLLDSRLTGTRVVPEKGAELFWRATSHGPIADASLDFPEPDIARFAGEAGSRIRVRVKSPTADIAVYIERGDLATVAVRRAIVCPTRACALGEPSPETPGVHLHPGEPIARVHGKRGRRLTRVSVSDPVIAATGLIASARVGVEFRPAKRADRGDRTWRRLPGPAALRSAPGGRVVARLSAAGAGVSVELLRRREDHALIRYDGAHATAVGWLPASRLRVGRLGSGGLGLVGGGPRIGLQRGTVLRDAKDGVAVGVLERASRLRVVSRDGEWTEVVVPTGAGDLELWVSSEKMVVAD